MENQTNILVAPTVNGSYYLKEYDDILMGRRKTYSDILLSQDRGVGLCAELLRNIFKIYLKWTPVDIREKLNKDIIDTMKLQPLIKRIPCPAEINPKKEFYYVAWYLYPETRTATPAELIIKLYEDILNGTLKKFPGAYFDGNDGYIRARILFLTMVREYLPAFENLEEMYAYFASSQGRNLLYEYKLNIPLKELYGTALAYLHDALPESQKDEALYEKYNTLAQKKYRTGKMLPVTKEELANMNGVEVLDLEDAEEDEEKENKPIECETIDLEGVL